MKKTRHTTLMAFAILTFCTSATLMVNCPGILDLNNPFNYESQTIPPYIQDDNTPPNNAITDEGATLGRVLFYDKNLSVDNTISCSSCHQQEFAFGDTATVSTGVDGVTGRHSMRLVNARFGNLPNFFWDKRANTLEIQTTQPIQDHVEMGFSGQNGDPDINDLIVKLEAIDYYPMLFDHAFGDPAITEQRMQLVLAQFVRSIQSFDSKYDVGRAQVGNGGAPFPNFTPEENMGKQLFRANPPNGGANCRVCHGGPEFSIANRRNNGVITVANNPTGIDLTNERSPSLRNLFSPSGELNGPMMHDGSFKTMLDVINHYDSIVIDSANNNLDNRLTIPGPGGQPIGQNLQLDSLEKAALIVFLQTLTGNDVYTNEKWSDPFDPNGNLTVSPVSIATTEVLLENSGITLYENSSVNDLRIDLISGNYQMNIKDEDSNIYQTINLTGDLIFDVCDLPVDLYFVEFKNLDNTLITLEKIVRE